MFMPLLEPWRVTYLGRNVDIWKVKLPFDPTQKTIRKSTKKWYDYFQQNTGVIGVLWVHSDIQR